ncbi:MAG: hypothetical protein ACO1OX_11355 [Novosphingobium sp.]
MDKVGPLSPMSLIASVGYLGACLAAIIAASVIHARARGDGRRSTDMIRHAKGWLVVGGSFFLFLIMRIAQVEDRLRSAGRAWIMVEHGYSKRWDWQAPAAALLVVLIFAALFFMWVRRGRRQDKHAPFPQMQRLAFAAVGAMVVLILLRLVSLHAIDSVLYHGPHLNWVVDTASTVVVMLAGIVSAVQKPRPARRVNRSRTR